MNIDILHVVPALEDELPQELLTLFKKYATLTSEDAGLAYLLEGANIEGLLDDIENASLDDWLPDGLKRHLSTGDTLLRISWDPTPSSESSSPEESTSPSSDLDSSSTSSGD